MKNEDIKKAFESLTPSNDAKERMLKAIIEKSASSPNTREKDNAAPWHIRFKTPLGVCTAAIACAAAFAITFLNPGLLNNKTSDFVETPTVCRSTTVSTSTAVITDFSAQTSEIIITNKKDDGMAAFAPASTENILNNAQKEISFTTTVMSQKTDSASTNKSECSSVSTTVNTTEAPVKTTTASSESTNHTETSDDGNNTGSSLYGDLFNFNSITWAGRNYKTDYIETFYSNINSFLGSGAAINYDDGKVYTVLIYELKNVPVEDGFAVQYIGQPNYYVFYNVPV